MNKDTKKALDSFMGGGGGVVMEEEKKYPQRTKQQNKAIHVLFKLLADTLNEHGFDMKKTLKPEIDIPWSQLSVKEFLWRPVQEAQVQKSSTTELTTKEIDEVFDTINKHLGERLGLHVPFPSIEELLLAQEGKDYNK